MPAVTGTPESILPRSDSKNPNTTCRGLTSNGRPCRRSLASSRSTANQGVFAVMPNIEDDEIAYTTANTTAYFCWQHKDQASTPIQSVDQVPHLQKRSSIDTLVERLGVLNTKDDTRTSQRSRKSTTNGRASLTQQKPPVSVTPASILADPFVNSPARIPLPPPRAVRKRQQHVQVSLFCCSRRNHHDELLPPARPISKVHPPETAPIPFQTVKTRKTNFIPEALSQQPSSRTTPASLENHLSYIPTSLSSSARTTLMAELTKPLTASDHEPGYIYVFWLTPKDVPHDAARLASSLLQPQGQRPVIRNRRRTSDVLREFNSDVNNQDAETPNTIMLKIGRASNVHRRMVQWSQQCGHHITLLRYYPYHKPVSLSPNLDNGTGPSSSERMARQESPSPTQKCPLVQRVERLIHTELAHKRVMRNCDGCGKEHREWFQVDATREGIKVVDEVVRRWIKWAQYQKSSTSITFNDK